MPPESFLRRAKALRAVALVAAATAFASSPLAAPAADMNKVIRYVFPAGEEGFDPAAAHDLYSGTVEQAIFETLLTYDYMARPAKLVPMTAEALPQIADNGQTYTVKIKKGIYFTPDPAFKGAKRELVAEDYVFSLKRLMSERVRGAKPSDPIVLDVRNLGKNFYSREGLFGKRTFEAVKGVSFQLPKGKTLGLVGESGSGKTTVGLTLMAEGECWIFDTWRMHNVLNPTARERIHLVCDTVGSESFWRLAATGGPARASPFVPYPPPTLRFESSNFPIVMSPWEFEGLWAGWLADAYAGSSDRG